MKLILTLATIAALAAASVHAGGPVIEDTETRAEPRDRNAIVPLIIDEREVVAAANRALAERLWPATRQEATDA